MDDRRPVAIGSVVRRAAWLTAVVCGAASALPGPYRFATDDAVSYLDVADAYRGGLWHTAINGYWSPMYSWILALAAAVLRPSAASEILVVRIVNLALLLVALAAFERLLRASRDAQSPLPKSVWLGLGYAIFLWSSLVWIGVRTDTPDMCAAACIYAAAALAVERRSGESGSWRMAALGVAAGAAYLAKAAMLPVGILCVAGGAVAPGRPGRSAARAACGFAMLALTIAPFVVPLSEAHHHFTVGDTGALNYAWHVFPTRRAVPNEQWQGGPPEFGTPLHPTRRVFTSPDVFEFDGPVGGTYPPWTDPSYWNEGLVLRFDAASQERVIATNLRVYVSLLLPIVAPFCLATFVLGGLRRSFVAVARDQWMLWVPAAAGFVTYLVATDLAAADIATQPSTRFVAPFAVMLLMAMLGGVRIPTSAVASAQRLSIGAVVLVATLLVVSTAKVVIASEREAPVALMVAERLHAVQADVCRVLSATGARIIVYKPRNGVEPAGWFPLTDGYYAYRLSGRAAGE